jgi:NAD(P)-dependent dehydrogenase (short-subunit alcohol dehydrogenase family)
VRIEQSVFLVTGGSSGLGLATARELVEQGGRVVLVDINADAGAAAAEELGASARFVRADITREDDARQAVAAALEDFGGLHGLVNCAGIVGAEKVLGKNGPHALGSFAKVINVNLIGSFNLLRLAAAAMAEGPADEGGERGVIINTASIAAYDGQIGQAAYAASKGAIASLTLPAARELARFGIRVMTIAPGIFETPMMAGMTDEVRASLSAGVPFPPRLGRPQEYAALARHIIENSMLNGEVIRLDGALRMAAK